jgi:hypothetical protein
MTINSKYIVVNHVSKDVVVYSDDLDSLLETYQLDSFEYSRRVKGMSPMFAVIENTSVSQDDILIDWIEILAGYEKWFEEDYKVFLGA